MGKTLSTLCILLTLVACAQRKERHAVQNNYPKSQRITKTDQEWRSELMDAEYAILREKGTERSFTSDLLYNKKKGTYVCAACNLPLFTSKTKFRSGTGWPSFYAPINEINVAEAIDQSHGMVRTEVLCARCNGHLGHVFTDGPQPTGLRYCINGLALDFEDK